MTAGNLVKHNAVVSPNSHIFVRPKKRWLFGYVWLFEYYVTIWVRGGFRIKDSDSSIIIRFLFIIQKIFSDKKLLSEFTKLSQTEKMMPINKKASNSVLYYTIFQK